MIHPDSKRAEAMNREGEQFLLEAVERFPGMLAYWTRDFHCVAANPAYYKWFGRTREQTLRMHYREWLGEALFAKNQPYLAAVLSGEDQRFERTIVKFDGSIAHSLVHYITRKIGGEVVGFFSYVADVTAIRRDQDQLRASDVALNSISQGVLICGLDGRIVWTNDAFSSITGYAATDVLGKKCDVLQGPLTEQTRVNALRAELAKTGVFAGELVNYRKDGSNFCNELTVSPVRSADGQLTHFIGVFRDVTERKIAQEQKARLEAELQQAQKLESVGRLAGGIAHDFNNMLTVILGHAELALNRPDVAKPVRDALAEIHKAAGRSAELTRQLLAFARKQTVAPKVLELNQTVLGMSKIIERLVGEQIHLTWRLSADPSLVKFDPSQIDQIVMNLCVNARDAIAGSGSITIETGNRHSRPVDTVHPADAIFGEYVWLAVSDTGCGMDEATQSRMFEPFFTTKETGKGTGLGLATVYGVVRQNEGWIDVRSKPGEGTTVAVYLPQHYDLRAVERTEDAIQPDQPCDETILVAENEPAILKLAVSILETQGYTVLAANIPQDALRFATDHPEQELGPIHLLLADLVMPGMNGIELARRVTRLHPRIKKVFMSGYATEVMSSGQAKEEEAHYLAKPFDKSSLLTTVRQALESN